MKTQARGKLSEAEESHIFAPFDKLTREAKKAAEEATKSVQEASKTALEASKTAAGVSKNTLEDLTYVGKSTLGDLTKSAKEVVTKKGLLRGDSFSKQGDSRRDSTSSTSLVASSGLLSGTGRDFFSNISSDINGITAATTSMFSDFFGGKSSQRNQQQQRTQQQQQLQQQQQQQQQQYQSKPKEKSGVFGPFPTGPRGLVEKSPLIKHSPRRQDELQRKQSVDRSATNTENQAFLKDVRL